MDAISHQSVAVSTDNQSHDFKPGFLKVLSLLRRKGRVDSPLWQWLLSRYYPRYKVLQAESFYTALIGSAAARAPTQTLEYYRRELAACIPLRAAHRARYGEAPDQRIVNDAFIAFYYAMVRETRPAAIVETGTATGAMTALMLAAMEQNNHGTLYSIDLAPRAGALTMHTTVPTEQVGCLIPEEFRHRWRLEVGDAKLLLPRVLIEADADIFIHDSLHTRSHMSFEFAAARALMRADTVIASDDALWNRAWMDFIHTHNLTSYACVRNPNVCVTVNKFDDYEKAQGIGIQS
ncbi:MAG: class I SAM-dependent methyltransferase [Burkholderiales bacterium]